MTAQATICRAPLSAGYQKSGLSPIQRNREARRRGHSRNRGVPKTKLELLRHRPVIMQPPPAFLNRTKVLLKTLIGYYCLALEFRLTRENRPAIMSTPAEAQTR